MADNKDNQPTPALPVQRTPLDEVKEDAAFNYNERLRQQEERAKHEDSKANKGK